MYSDCLASSSRLTMQDIWDSQAPSLVFPLSDCRSEGPLPDLNSRRTMSVPIEGSTKPPPATSPPTLAHALQFPVRSQVSPGVIRDGKNIIYTAEYPEVKQLLDEARKTLTLPQASSDVILTLAALEVFYRPSDPAHWMFWSDEKKNDTAEIVTRVSLHTPPLIMSSVAWNGKSEYLSILANHHGSTWRPMYENKDWYAILVPPKPATPPRSLNLRKRRAAPGAFREPSRSPVLEDELDEPIVKRGRNASRPNSPERAAHALVEKHPARSRASRSKRKVASIPPPSPPGSGVLDELPLTLSPDQALTPLSEITDLPSESSSTSRRKRKISPASRYSQLLPSEKDISPALIEASLLMATAPAPERVQTQVPTHSRTRSTSTDSSSTTVVQFVSSRSSSVSSGVTAVGSGNQTALKRKVDVVEQETEELDPPQSELEDEDSVTRTRATRSKKRAKITVADDAASSNGKLSKVALPSNRRKPRKA